jgi:hypothetical protein
MFDGAATTQFVYCIPSSGEAGTGSAFFPPKMSLNKPAIAINKDAMQS